MASGQNGPRPVSREVHWCQRGSSYRKRALQGTQRHFTQTRTDTHADSEHSKGFCPLASSLDTRVPTLTNTSAHTFTHIRKRTQTNEHTRHSVTAAKTRTMW